MATTVGGSYYIAIHAADAYGLGLRSLASTYAGGAETYMDGGAVVFAAAGRDTSFAIVPVPEPEAYALMLAGGLVGFAARRRKLA